MANRLASVRECLADVQVRMNRLERLHAQNVDALTGGAYVRRLSTGAAYAERELERWIETYTRRRGTLDYEYELLRAEEAALMRGGR